jgi:hypothetical protein
MLPNLLASLELSMCWPLTVYRPRCWQVTATSVRAKWDAPAEDNGAAILVYRCSEASVYYHQKLNLPAYVYQAPSETKCTLAELAALSRGKERRNEGSSLITPTLSAGWRWRWQQIVGVARPAGARCTAVPRCSRESPACSQAGNTCSGVCLQQAGSSC